MPSGRAVWNILDHRNAPVEQLHDVPPVLVLWQRTTIPTGGTATGKQHERRLQQSWMCEFLTARDDDTASGIIHFVLLTVPATVTLQPLKRTHFSYCMYLCTRLLQVIFVGSSHLLKTFCCLQRPEVSARVYIIYVLSCEDRIVIMPWFTI